MVNLKNERGAALIVTLFVLVVLLSLSAIFMMRSVNENNLARLERDLVKAFYIGEAAAHAGLFDLNEFINVDLSTTISQKTPQVISNSASSYVGNDDPLGFLIEYAKDNGTALFVLNGAGDMAIHDSNIFSLDTGDYEYDLVVSKKTSPVAVGPDSWDFSYDYRVEGKGTAGNLDRAVFISGDFTIRVQRDNFAKFALFTNHHQSMSGYTVWFTDNTNFSGPVHTNERFSYAFNPSGVFDGIISQSYTQARYYNNGSPVLLDADFNGSTDVPVFNNGFYRNQPTIVLPSGVAQQDLYDQASGGSTISTNGVYVPNDGANCTGGIFVRGDATITMTVDGSNNAVYNVSEGTTGAMTITVDRTNNQTSLDDGSSVTTYSGLPNGIDGVGTIIYVDGQVDGVSGVVQKDTELTISSANDLVITGNLIYDQYNPGSGTPGTSGYVPPNAANKTNLLGLLSWGGSIRIGNSAPDDVNIHGIVFARNGVFEVDDYNDQGVGPRGTATLMGGVISDYYGAFGLFSGSTGNQLSGYGRNFVYDERTLQGKSPPYFPTLNTFIGFTNDLTDKLIWQEGAT